jgi:hypothetical protein
MFANVSIVVNLRCFQGQVPNPDTKFIVTQTDQETSQINKYIKKQITVGNCHIWKGQQLTSYRIFEFRFRKHKIKLCVHRVK